MPSTLQAYDALSSSASSTTPTLHQPESQLSCEAVEPSPESPTSHLPSRTCNLRYWKNWEWEFAACLLVLATPIILFATLYPHHGQPLPQWPFKLSINSLISVYTLVLKAAIGVILTSCIGQLQWMWFSETRPLTDMLLFDNATRGADGALGLIWRQRFREPLTALGCVIMVLAVAVDPFVQQLVRPVDCSVEVSDRNAIATLPRANVFERLGYNLDANITDPTRGKFDLGLVDKDIDGALYDAIFSPGQGPPRQCSTGNCTFTDTYGTIGICSSCQDSSADVTITATCSDPDSSYASHHPTSGADCPKNSSFTLDSNFTASEYINLGTRMEIFSVELSNTPLVAAGDSETTPEGFLGLRNLLFRFLIGATAGTGGRIDWTTSGSSRCDSDKPKGSWSCQGYGAATCSLQPCIQIYNASISAGILEENLVESSSDTAWGMIYDNHGMPLYLALIDTRCAAQVQTPSDWSSSMGSRWLPYNFNLSVTLDSVYDMDAAIHLPDDAQTLLESGCLYLMSADIVLLATGVRLEGTIEASALSVSGSWAGDTEVDMSDFEGPEMLRAIYNWGHTDFERVRASVANISESLTTYIRAHGGSPNFLGSTDFSKDVQGKVYHYATCLQVQWPWLSYPTSLAILTVSFFVMVSEVTRRQGASVWKASPLAWVLRVEGPSKEILPSSNGSCKKMKDRSTQIAVHLFDGDLDGPRICIADLKDPNLL